MDEVYTVQCVGNRRLELHRQADGDLLMKVNLHRRGGIKTLANLVITEDQWKALEIALKSLRPPYV